MVRFLQLKPACRTADSPVWQSHRSHQTGLHRACRHVPSQLRCVGHHHRHAGV